MSEEAHRRPTVKPPKFDDVRVHKTITYDSCSHDYRIARLNIDRIASDTHHEHDILFYCTKCLEFKRKFLTIENAKGE